MLSEAGGSATEGPMLCSLAPWMVFCSVVLGELGAAAPRPPVVRRRELVIAGPWVTWGFGPRVVDELEERVARVCRWRRTEKPWRVAKRVLWSGQAPIPPNLVFCSEPWTLTSAPQRPRDGQLPAGPPRKAHGVRPLPGLYPDVSTSCPVSRDPWGACWTPLASGRAPSNLMEGEM